VTTTSANGSLWICIDLWWTGSWEIKLKKGPLETEESEIIFETEEDQTERPKEVDSRLGREDDAQESGRP